MKPCRKKSVSPKDSCTPVEITGKSFHVSLPLKHLIIEKSRHLPPMETIRVIITSHKDKQGTEVHIIASQGKEVLQTKVYNDNPYTAVIQGFKKIRTRANKYQNKHLNKIKHSIRLKEKEERLPLQEDNHELFTEWPLFPAMDAWDALKHFGYVPKSEKKKISKKKISINTLSSDEAIRQLESSKDNLLIFLNEKEHKIQCLHKQHDGNYVLIEPSLYRGFHIF
ncbi:sigma 54 modulation/S30EA ribosomal C-terminal domain-containing protein [Candidatus Chlamydia sanziniae]|uniref:Ribosomal subunit interface protein n=1 Tax=Candidatus Chlamydia sanziniae TaxID=1806891 RepID=A0A1A9HTR5_9CHLA|nr:sigma 54 modulation/S30EA ribosomal C-terminal domain-containing protein [Candidatus Chlamydia sanziniae]ANH78388.1 Ribosomal subunit interface protein [Candidatus Chlamydia sanziniae]